MNPGKLTAMKTLSQLVEFENCFFIHKVYPLHARSKLLILIKRNLKGILHNKSHYSANIYLFKVNNRNTRKRCEICLKLTIKTPERCH